MNFTSGGNRIVCSRIDNTVVDDKALYKRVIEFDAQGDSVPSHVAARLTTSEVEELKTFISERKRVGTNSPEENLLEALPELLQEATNIIDSVESVNRSMYETLCAAIANLKGALDNIKQDP